MKKLVYTSFDGDDMVYIDCMREIAIKNNFIPINPEHALGYYISTISHKNLKREVMKDCISLCMMKDEFWLFSNNEKIELEMLSEGIIAEILLWMKIKNNKIRVFSFKKILGGLSTNNFSYKGQIKKIKKHELNNLLISRYGTDIKNFLKKVEGKLRPTVFIDIPNKNFKYADWARVKAYESGSVPLIPQYLISELVYHSLGIFYEYKTDVETLKIKSHKIWAIFSSDEELNELKNLYCKSNNVSFLSVQILGIPKFCEPKKWSLTKKEILEIENLTN